jgi:phytoene synthase
MTATLAEARTTTRRVARTFSLACRMLPRTVRDDVYWLYLVFRTLDDLVDDGRPEAYERLDAVDDWAAGVDGPRTQEVEILAALAERHALPRDAPACARTWRGRGSRPKPTWTATATASRARSGW